MEQNNFITVEEFNQQVSAWAHEVRNKARQTLSNATRSTGLLESHLIEFIDKDKKNRSGAAYIVKFCFERYGVFRAYGAGRGWVVVNGQLRRGFKVRSESDRKNRLFSSTARQMLQRGYTTSQLSRMKVATEHNTDNGKNRQPLDWLDTHVEAAMEKLADIAQEFYVDSSQEKVADAFSKSKIVKG